LLKNDYPSGINAKELGKLASDASDASGDSSVTITDDKNVEKISIKHSAAAHVLTNNDVEDIEDVGIKNCSSSSGGESL